jgi:hypothetical protein
MNISRRVVLPFLLACSFPLLAHAAPRTVTGSVLAVTPNSIVLQQGTDKWELSKEAATKDPGHAKVGDLVTVEYRMVATSIDAPSERSPKEAKPLGKGTSRRTQKRGGQPSRGELPLDF